MVILLSTRGTAGSDIWFMCLADKPMVRGYHLRDYDWTPLSQNPVQKMWLDTASAPPLAAKRHTIIATRKRPISASAVAKPQHDGSWRTLTNAFACRSDSYHIRRRGARSFVDDLVLSRGVVLSRADLFCDLLRLSPMTRRFVRFRRTYLQLLCCVFNVVFYLFVFICVYLCLFVFICVYLCLFVFICVYLCLFVFICVYLCLFVFICVYLCLFVFICVFIYYLFTV